MTVLRRGEGSVSGTMLKEVMKINYFMEVLA
jgi:hypothetical protein